MRSRKDPRENSPNQSKQCLSPHYKTKLFVQKRHSKFEKRWQLTHSDEDGKWQKLQHQGQQTSLGIPISVNATSSVSDWDEVLLENASEWSHRQISETSCNDVLKSNKILFFFKLRKVVYEKADSRLVSSGSTSHFVVNWKKEYTWPVGRGLINSSSLNDSDVAKIISIELRIIKRKEIDVLKCGFIFWTDSSQSRSWHPSKDDILRLKNQLMVNSKIAGKCLTTHYVNHVYLCTIRALFSANFI